MQLTQLIPLAVTEDSREPHVIILPGGGHSAMTHLCAAILDTCHLPENIAVAAERHWEVGGCPRAHTLWGAGSAGVVFGAEL